MSTYLQSAQPVPAASQATAPATRDGLQLAPGQALVRHWREYAMEAAGLGFFMLSACLFGALYESAVSPVRQAVASSFVRRLLMGFSMGLTAIVLIYSSWGKQSGAHFNPSVTLSFFRLGKIKRWDAVFYVVAQFAGGLLGVALMALLLGKAIADPNVRYVVTVPGKSGIVVAFAVEFLMALGMMTMVLYVSNHRRLSRFTGLFAGLMVASYITLAAPFSGMSMNPARTFSSALPAGVFDGLWIYFIAPPLGMLLAAELYRWRKGVSAIGCCKLHHDNSRRCIFCGANGGFAV